MKRFVKEAMKQLYLHFAWMGNPEFLCEGLSRRGIYHAVFAAQQEEHGHSKLGVKTREAR